MDRVRPIFNCSRSLADIWAKEEASIAGKKRTACNAKSATPTFTSSPPRPDARTSVANTAANDIDILARPLHRIVAILVQNTLWESLIRTLRSRADSEEAPGKSSSP